MELRQANAVKDILRRMFGHVAVVWVLVVLSWGCGRDQPGLPSLQAASFPVVAADQLHVVAYRLWPREVRVQGTLIADLETVVGAEVAGLVRDVKVDLGQEVGVQTELLHLDPEPFRLRVQQARAELEQVRSKLGLKPNQADASLDPKKAPVVLQEQAIVDRARFYLEQAHILAKTTAGAIPASELSKLEVDLRVAEARLISAHNTVNETLAMMQVKKVELDQALKDQERAVVRAPFKGKIVARHRLPGSYVKVGDPVFTIIRTDVLRFHAGAPEKVGRQLELDMPLRILVENHPTPIPARITRLSPLLDPMTLTRTLQADVDNRKLNLPAGTFAEADLVVDAKESVIAVPASTVTEFAGEERVWQVRDSKLQSVRVHAGRRSGEWIEIVRGLVAGDVVLRDASQGKTGLPVQAPR